MVVSKSRSRYAHSCLPQSFFNVRQFFWFYVGIFLFSV